MPTRRIARSAAAVLALAAVGYGSAAMAQGYGPGMMRDWGLMDGWRWIGPFNMIFWLILLAVIIAVIVWFVQSPRRSGSQPLSSPPSSGLTTLDERYARGEINRDEYLQKRNDILVRR